MTVSRPCIDKSLLEKYKDGLIISTACLGGEIPQAILKGRIDVAENIAIWFKKLLGDDFYLEIQDHGSVEDRIVNVELIELVKNTKLKLLLLMMLITSQTWMLKLMMPYFVFLLEN